MMLQDVLSVQLPRAYATSFAVLSGSGEVCAIVQPGRLVEIWNLAANQRIELWRIRSQPLNLLLSYDGRFFTVLCEDGWIGTVDHVQGPLKGTFRRYNTDSLAGFRRPISAEASRASGVVRATHGMGFILSNGDGDITQRSEMPSPTVLALSSYGGIVAAADATGQIIAWETRTWCTVCDVRIPDARVLGMAIKVTADGATLLALSMAPDGAVRLSRVQLPGAVFAELDAYLKAKFSRFARNIETWGGEIEVQVANLREEQAALVDEIAASRAQMVDALVSLDPLVREKTRSTIAASAKSLAGTQVKAWLKSFWQLITINPLTKFWASVAAIILLGVAGLVVNGTTQGISEGLTHFAHTLQTPKRELTAVTTFVTTAGILVLLGRGWPAVRAIRNVMRLITIAAMAGTIGIGVSESRTMGSFTTTYLHAQPIPAWHETLPYPIWLGLIGACIVTAIATFGKWLVRFVRRSQERQIAVGDALVQAIVGIAYGLRQAADDPAIAGDAVHRRRILDQIQLAARLAEREWVYAHRLTHAAGDDSIRLQGYAIAHAIRRRNVQIALGGPGLQRAAEDFAVAVANAAEGDWRALGDDIALLPPLRRNRLVRLLVNVAILVLPVGLAIVLMTIGTKHFAAATPAAYLLVSVSVAHLLSLLRLSEDFDTGSKISAVLHP